MNWAVVRHGRSWAKLGFVVVVLAGVNRVGFALDQEEAVGLARKFLAADDDDERGELLKELAEYDGDYQPVLDELQDLKFKKVRAGYHPEEHFTIPELLENRPDDLLYFNVPRGYRPDRATGLIIFMHGGGRRSSRYAPRYSMDYESQADSEENSQLGDIFDRLGVIGVGPSAPWDEDTAYRWCVRESDDYLADVVRECRARFNIDPDRVVLLGHSMGGFGAYHHIQRQPDRFAAVLVNAGSWTLAYWPAIRGTPLGIVHGVKDAIRGERWHYTDIEYARWTDKILSRQKPKLDYVYYEHEGEHGISPSKELMEKYLKSAVTYRRDPYAPQIALASPLGFDDDYCYPVKHNRWLTLDEATNGKIQYDELVSNRADDFDAWRLRYRTGKFKGSSIEAINQGDNTIEATTRNVARFTIWLHPKMVDVKKPVTVKVDGRQRFSDRVEPSLATALESYTRRGDWGMIYPMKIEIGGEEE
jgi:pimeloyl-ACP methyl ester carboxylesterase